MLNVDQADTARTLQYPNVCVCACVCAVGWVGARDWSRETYREYDRAVDRKRSFSTAQILGEEETKHTGVEAIKLEGLCFPLRQETRLDQYKHTQH